MKKVILALSTAALTTGALAASTNTISTSTKTSGMTKFLKSTKASLYINADRANVDTDVTTAAQYLILRNTINDDFSTKLEIRNLTQDVATADAEANTATMIDPRFTVYGFRTKVGEVSISPALRTEIAINDNSDDRYARLRLGVTASMDTNSANNIAAFVGTYETITKSNASKELADTSNLYVWVADTYNLNDQHGFTALYENFRAVNQDTLTASSKTSESDLSLYYNNSQIKNLSLAPYVSHNMANNIDADLISFGLDATYAF